MGRNKNIRCSKCGKNIENENCSYCHGTCKECDNKRHKKWQHANKDRYNELVRIGMKKRYKKVSRQYPNIVKQLKINGCAICGYDKCLSALEFHHTNPDDKSYAINQLALTFRNDEKIVAELNKCILLCANCHREIEAKARLTS